MSIWTLTDMGAVILTLTAVLLTLLVLAWLIYLLVLVRPAKTDLTQNRDLMCNYAHRGLHGGSVPENSLAAFERAAQAGHGIELDVQTSRDGIVMVFHDEHLGRMTGRDQRLCELSAAELQTLSLGGTDQTIPTLAEVLALVNGRVPLLIELKGERFDTSLCPKVAALLRAYNGRYCIESFNPLLVRAMRRELPTALCGLLYTNVCREKGKRTVLTVLLTAMAFNVLARPTFIAYDQRTRDSLPVRLTVKLYRAPHFVWTVRSKADHKAAKAHNENAIFEIE